MKSIVFAETKTAACEICAGARQYSDEVIYVTFDAAVSGIADKCILLSVPEGRPKEVALEAAYSVICDEGVGCVFFEPTRRLKIIIGRIASRMGVSVITDAIAFDGDTVESMFFGGIATRKTRSLSHVRFVSVSPGVFDAADNLVGSDEIKVVPIEEAECGPLLVETCSLPPAEVDLTAAAKVVAAGRGFASYEELDDARVFCDRFGAELGCTRPLTENETWFPREAYIGVSGLMLSPDVYVGIGVSGQMQHMVGVNRAKSIFAINKDGNAPIFDKVDYGLVGEISKVLPEINQRLS